MARHRCFIYRFANLINNNEKRRRRKKTISNGFHYVDARLRHRVDRHGLVIDRIERPLCALLVIEWDKERDSNYIMRVCCWTLANNSSWALCFRHTGLFVCSLESFVVQIELKLLGSHSHIRSDCLRPHLTPFSSPFHSMFTIHCLLHGWQLFHATLHALSQWLPCSQWKRSETEAVASTSTWQKEEAKSHHLHPHFSDLWRSFAFYEFNTTRRSRARALTQITWIKWQLCSGRTICLLQSSQLAIVDQFYGPPTQSRVFFGVGKRFDYNTFDA